MSIAKRTVLRLKLARCSRLGACFAALAALSWCSGIRAQAMQVFGFDAAARGMAGARTGFPDPSGALYYNPAHLVLAHRPLLFVQAGYHRLSLDARMDIAESSASDLPEPNEKHGVNQDAGTLGIGVVLPLSAFLEGRHWYGDVSLAAFAELPWDKVIHQKITHDDTPCFLVAEPPERTMLYLGGAAAPLPWLSVGAGVIVSFAFDVAVDIGVDTSFLLGDEQADTPDESVDVSSYTWVAPVAGLSFRLVPGLAVGVSYRGSLVDEMHLEQTIDTTGFVKQHILMIFDRSLLVQPRQVALGASYDLDGLILSIEAVWLGWDQYSGPSGRWKMIRRGGNPEKNLVDVTSAPDPGFRSTVSAAAGLELALADGVRFRTGYRYSPTPVPDQAEPGTVTNLLDSDRHLFSMGLTLGVTSMGRGRIGSSLELFLQYSWMEGRRYKREPAASTGARYLGAAFSGKMLAAGAGFEVVF